MNKQFEISSLLSLDCRSLATLIYKAEVPEQIVRELAPQTLFSVVKLNGLESSADLIEMCTSEQLQHMIDLDIWNGDELSEEHLFSWLALCDTTQDLDLLEKIVSCTDLKIIALLISRYVEIHIQTEATYEPPNPKFFTPDKGYTWLNITAEDSDLYFYLGRVIAQIFELNTELFYQLIGVVHTTTQTILEEESYLDKERRIASLAIPDVELAAQINQSLSDSEILEFTTHKDKKIIPAEVSPLPLIFENGFMEPLSELLGSLAQNSTWKEELSYILNAAIRFWKVPFYEISEVLVLASKVKGCINIGLQSAINLSHNKQDLNTLYESFRLEGFYRLGLRHIFEIKKKASSKSLDNVQTPTTSVAYEILTQLQSKFPGLTTSFLESGFDNSERTGEADLISEISPISSLEQVKAILTWLAQLD